ncbi:dolichol kinase [Halovenus sp. WSH3]|uniref:Dolichol kinase n=1 Tax=Halovenus carboxidivorans TaxID=2692199 RepID=A0A6B0T578_9EURY|nr:dolichol kinase [Halovenus carboxidivorans]MXR50472.1 dolichol kinase [Halovenus carboxidivorans]
MSSAPTAFSRIEQRLRGEVGRRLVHASGTGIPLLYLLNLITWGQARALYLLFAGGAIVLESLRLIVGLDVWLFTHLIREYEEDNIAGYVLYMLSSTVTAVSFEPQVAVPAILMLTLGDPISGTVGGEELRVVKRPKALLAMFVVSAAITAPFYYTTPIVVVCGGLAGTIADGVKPIIRGYVIDDNLTIPIVAAVGIRLGLELAGSL